jgi:hypothetical protein
MVYKCDYMRKYARARAHTHTVSEGKKGKAVTVLNQAKRYKDQWDSSIH